MVSGQESETLHPNEGAVRRSTHEGGPRFLLRMAKPSLITQQYHAVAAAVKGLHLQFQEISSCCPAAPAPPRYRYSPASWPLACLGRPVRVPPASVLALCAASWGACSWTGAPTGCATR